MFQFRRFPSYTYLFQCRMPGFSPGGLPHSDIHGSRDICSSPWLFAACHVLRRLLMPRHSPCALFSLTFVEANSGSFAPAFRQGLSLRCSSFSSRTRLPWAPLGLEDAVFRRSFRLRQRILGSLELCRLFKDSRNCNCYPSLSMFHN